MRTFTCGHCGADAVFENVSCVRCGHPHAFDPGPNELVTDDARDRCANAGLIGCNWVAAEAGGLCASCALTRTRPADADAEGLRELGDAERAKRRLLFELHELGLSPDGLTFDLLSSQTEPVTTGHADGLITLDLAEADDAHREEMRTQMGERYRTLLGHFRHEVGHFYFEVLCPDEAAKDRARPLFGDEREDYSAAMDRHYETGPPADWPERFVSAYATMHPFEDWAETFAHYLHIRDTLQTAGAYRVMVGHDAPGAVPAESGFDRLVDAWLPLTYALNALNRSMGADDAYPFVLTPPVIEKLSFVHDLIRGRRPDA